MNGVKQASPAQLDHHIANLDSELQGKLMFLALEPRHSLSAGYRRRCEILRTMIERCRTEYKRKTGKAYYYVYQVMPTIIVTDVKAINDSVQASIQKSEMKRIADLIYLGREEGRRMRGSYSTQLNNFYNSGFSNLIIANWVTFFGGTHPQLLKLKANSSFPKIFRLLDEAEAASRTKNFSTAHHKLALAAKEMKEIHELYAEFLRRVQGGGEATIMVIKFYAAVAAGGAGAAAGVSGGVGMTAAQQAAVAVANEGAYQGTSLLLRGDKENISAKDVSGAVFDVALAGATAAGSKQLADTLKAIAPKIGQGIAQKAVDRYFKGFSDVNPKYKAEVLAAVSAKVRERMLRISMAAFAKTISQIKDFPNEPTFNFWENVFIPLVGDLDGIIKVYVSKSDKYKQKMPAGSK